MYSAPSHSTTAYCRYDWGSNTGSSGTLSNESYRGTAPFSEPETRAYREIFTNNQIMTAITDHTWGELIQYAWSYQNTNPGHEYLAQLGREMADICLYAEQVNNAMYDANGGHDDYVFATAGTLGYTFEHGSFGFIRPYMGEANYGTYGAMAPYNDAYGNQRRIPLTYPTATQVNGAKAPAQDVTAEVVILTSPFIPGHSVGSSSKFSTVAMVQAVASQLNGKILMAHRASSNANNAAVAKAAQDAGAVGVIFCANTTGDQNEYYVPNIGTTGDALLINIPVGGTIRMMLREYDEHVQKGGKNELTLTSAAQAGNGSIYYHFERLVGAYIHNIKAAHTYTSYIKGSVTDGTGAAVEGAALDLSIDVKSRVRQSNGTLLPDDTYIDTRRSHLDVTGSTYSWAVTPSKQPHFDNAGYAVTAGANGRYSQTKTVNVTDYKQTISDVNFVLPQAITVDYDFSDMINPGKDVTVPFTTYVLSADGASSAKGAIDGVTATVGGLPVTVTAAGGGDYTATFKASALSLDDLTGVDFVISAAGAAFTQALNLDVDYDKIKASISAKPQTHYKDPVEYTLSIRDAVNVLALELEVEVDGDMLTGTGAAALADFNILSQKWEPLAGNKWKGTFTLGFMDGKDTAGFTSEDPADVLKMTFAANALGETTVTVTGLKAVGFSDVLEEVYAVNVIVEAGDGATVILNVYDLNSDGFVDLLDLGIMLLYVGYLDTDTGWGDSFKAKDVNGAGITAKRCDVNNDGTVDMLDLLELIANFD